MTNTAKPPMIVWLQNQQSLDEEQWRDDDVTWCRDRIFKHDVGPYVHLDQLMAEVGRRANGIMQKWSINIAEARGEALRLLADELRR